MTTTYPIPPCFYPTTTVFLDDDEAFLATAQVFLPEAAVYRTFADVDRALEFIDRETVRPPQRRCIREGRQRGPRDPADIPLSLDMLEMVAELEYPQRFDAVSVAVVDYDMNGRNGLDVCQRLCATPVRRVLLTGAADERLAVEAFNEGVIDAFYLKHEPHVAQRLQGSVRDLQHRYFDDREDVVVKSLGPDYRRRLDDPAFVALFDGLRETHHIVEFYLTAAPAGFMMVDAGGAAYRLLYPSEEQWQAQVTCARRGGAPADVVEGLTQRTLVGRFDPDGYYPPHGEDQWRAQVVRTEPLAGRRSHAYALHESSALATGGFEGGFYEDYLERLAKSSGGDRLVA